VQYAGLNNSAKIPPDLIFEIAALGQKYIVLAFKTAI
jgi:hypothetical protein